jgi:putative NADPH-quinone reductase
VTRRITIIQGHPDATTPHYCHALAGAYAQAAIEAGYEVRRIEVAELEFPLLHSKQQFEHEPPPDAIRQAQESILWANHLLIIHPLWLGMMPATLKAFLEQVFRPGFSHEIGANGIARRLLKGRSARIVVTMGMPALAYRWFFGAHGLKALRRSVLWFCGIGPIRETLIGAVESAGAKARERGLQSMRTLGRAGQ